MTEFATDTDMIDWARVNELRDEVGCEDFADVVHLFLEEVEDVVNRLKSGVQTENLEADLHFLRGSALSLGFASFSKICLQVEQNAAAGRASSEDISDVLYSFFSSKTEFQEGLPDALAA